VGRREEGRREERRREKRRGEEWSRARGAPGRNPAMSLGLLPTIPLSSFLMTILWKTENRTGIFSPINFPF
jgi:hypothetical protein